MDTSVHFVVSIYQQKARANRILCLLENRFSTLFFLLAIVARD
jgi:hypothetical protein